MWPAIIAALGSVLGSSASKQNNPIQDVGWNSGKTRAAIQPTQSNAGASLIGGLASNGGAGFTKLIDLIPKKEEKKKTNNDASAGVTV